ncbi:WhiB family transcriptional regulator [Nocardioides ferulae]|uniref:WhiB family transcriptional regulator n=1 Tax=Nocardioides ferulae TaxID=2340821 RepID=UPI000EACACE2|nr:WhiB family transcriptional regulator [Nocardioides ferulae]
MGRPPALPGPATPPQETVPPILAVDGACADARVGDVFFEEDTYAEAAAVCGRCPVQAICLAYALPNESHGVWGGLTPEERRTARGGTALLRIEDRRAADDLRAAVAAQVPHEDLAARYAVNVRTIERWVADQRALPHPAA